MDSILAKCIRAVFALLLLTLATSSFAVPPFTRHFDEINRTYDIADCGDFHVIADETISQTRTVFFDQAGRPVRVQNHVRFSATFTNSLTGASLTDSPDPFLFVVDLVNGGFTVHGLTAKATDRGEGIVLLDAGTISVAPDGSVTLHGPHIPDVEAALCEALG